MTFHMVLAIGQWLLSSSPDQLQRPYYGVARSLFTVQMLDSGTLGNVYFLNDNRSYQALLVFIQFGKGNVLWGLVTSQ